MIVLRFYVVAVVGLLLQAAQVGRATERLPRVAPESRGMSSQRLAEIDGIVAASIENGQMPGCVVCIGRGDAIVWLKPYGHRQVEPEPIEMTVDTLFDLASLTKPIATATSVMQLVERGQVRLRDRISMHLPEFEQNGKERVTVHDLLVHQGGLIPDNALKDYDDGIEKSFERIYALDLKQPAGEKFVYTDVGFIVLAELVKRKTGLNIHEYTQQHVFGPLGMTETGYVPDENLRQRAAATEKRDGEWMKGEVHDPRAYRLNGIAGHAGLFSTADDLAVYALALLRGGSRGSARILSPRGVQRMTASYPVNKGQRGLGWDKLSGYSSNRGEFNSPESFGHGGFTGTVIWIDPVTDLFVIFLSNRLHPDGKGSVNRLAGRIGTIATSAIESPLRARGTQAHSVSTQVVCGIDTLREQKFAPLRDKRVGLITNHTGIDGEGNSTVKVLFDAPEVQLSALFSPEHGFEGRLDQAIVDDSEDKTTGIKIFSLYGKTRRPTAEMLSTVDVLVFDIQDIGARFYTYVSTMGEAMRAAAEAGKEVVVLDRPNPINGTDVAGPMLDDGRESFVAYHHLPVRHGMTVAELARMFQAELELDLKLTVIPVRNWRRNQYFDSTGLLWVNPSPNMRCLTQALLYPGVGLLETTNLSVGRGTDTPFEIIGAPWINGRQLAHELNAAGLPGIRFIPLEFVPESSKFAEETCHGVNLVITERAQFEPLRVGFELAAALRRLWPNDWEVDKYDRLLRNAEVLEAVKSGESAINIHGRSAKGVAEFLERRARFLLYP